MTEETSGIRIHQDRHLGWIELARGPHNYFDEVMIQAIADACERFEADNSCRVIVLCAEGKAFCAGANFSGDSRIVKQRSPREVNPLYNHAIRIFSCTKPIVVEVQGAAIGGGLGLALVGDFRVASTNARFSANFNRLGFHPGFGLSHTLPALVGLQKAARLFYTGQRIDGSQALSMGLVDELTTPEDLRSKTTALAREIAISSPRAVQSTRTTLKGLEVEKIRQAVARESTEQAWQLKLPDFQEGVAAMAERRNPQFAD